MALYSRARLIYNPTAGREEIRHHLPQILEILETGGLEVSCHATRDMGDAQREATRAVQRGFDVIIAAGGDGTINEVVSGISPFSAHPPLGIIPAGISNDLASSLGIPRPIKLACEVIARGRTMEVDTAQVGNRYFINVAACGSITEVSYQVPSRLKTYFGQLAYYVKGLEYLPKLGPLPLELEGEGFSLKDEVMLFIAANGRVAGGFEQLAPLAQLDDGLLDVLVVSRINIPDLIYLAGAALKGEHLKHPAVSFFRTPYLKASSPHAVRLNLDGEWGGYLPAEIKVLPRHLTIFIP